MVVEKGVPDPAGLVRRLVIDVMVGGDFDALPEIYAPEYVERARRWIAPFRESFPDVLMEIVKVVADGGRVAAHFRCSGTHLGDWQGVPPTGQRFEGIDEFYFFKVRDGLLGEMTAVEDTRERLRQLGIAPLH